ncbi:MAG: von Willebrand factor [Candidatus Peribacteria bacterium]|nr:von Willebrand factor [Candidatus Peribacteria bacterium]
MSYFFHRTNERTNQRTNFFFVIGFLLITIPGAVSAAPLTYRYNHHLFTVDPAKEANWFSAEEVWTYNGLETTLPAAYKVDGDTIPPLPDGFVRTEKKGINKAAVRASLTRLIAPVINRPAGTVTIRTASGKIVFDGAGLTGQTVDVNSAADLTAAALSQNMTDIFLPVRETQPTIHVLDPALAAQGIKEVVTVGESDFSNSPPNRLHNIGVGFKKFNGHLIPQGSIFSFLDILGPVDGSTGYKKELVIKGDRTVPDYGGGLCQVSSTAYRGIWEYGFPIVSRQNHSYIVSHYAPVGTDATVFTPAPDMKFQNDSPAALLIQTYTAGNNAYFIYYGTRDTRTSTVVGPYIWDRVGPPADRIEPTTELPVGQKKTLQQRVPGEKVMWYRLLTLANGTQKTENFYSSYQAKPFFYQIGIDAAVPVNADGTAAIPSGDVESGNTTSAPGF